MLVGLAAPPRGTPLMTVGLPAPPTRPPKPDAHGEEAPEGGRYGGADVNADEVEAPSAADAIMDRGDDALTLKLELSTCAPPRPRPKVARGGGAVPPVSGDAAAAAAAGSAAVGTDSVAVGLRGAGAVPPPPPQ